MPFNNLIQTLTPTAASDTIPAAKTELSMLKSLPLDELINRAISGIVSLAINLAIAVVVFYVGKFLINRIYRLVGNILHRRNVDTSLTTFVLSFIKIVLYFILIVTVIGILGVETSSFLALFASAGVAIGMALSGTLQNFAGGVLILLLKPYKVNDYIEAQGYAGTVKEIQIFHTLIVTPDNKSIIIPNGGLSTGSINNWSKEAFRRVDWTIGITYGNDIKVARDTLVGLLLDNPWVVKNHTDYFVRPDAADSESESEQRSLLAALKHHTRHSDPNRTETDGDQPEQTKTDHAPSVVLSNLADSAVELKVRAWVPTDKYWGVYFSMMEKFYDELPKVGIEFPFPQLDVHFDPSFNNKQ